jgi:aerobic carbon-monoxide dehydrogenase medium subunit
MLRELARYHRPGSLREALQLMKQPHTLALAGGTELLGHNDTLTEGVVDLQDLGLDYVRAHDDGIRIGAMTRLQAFIDQPSLKAFAGGLLARAASASTANTERQAATVGGAMAAGPAESDLLASLLVFDAAVEIQTAESRTVVPAEALLAGRRRYLTPDAIITEIMLPVQPPGAMYAEERVSRTPADRAIVCLAVRLVLRDGKLFNVRVAAGGAGDCVMRLIAAEAVLEGSTHEASRVEDAARAATSAVSPPSDHRATSEYRRAMVGVMLARVLAELCHS